MQELSDTAKFLVTLLNNANDLIVRSSNKKDAKFVMEALRVYAKTNKFELSPLSQERIDNFFAVLIDARPITLTNIIHDIAGEIVVADSNSRKVHAKNKVPKPQK
jgi:hypothetical protein